MAKASNNQMGNVNQRIDNLERRIKALEKLSLSAKNETNISSSTIVEKTSSQPNYQSDNQIRIPIQLIGSATIPQYANTNDAGFDFRADQDYYVSPGCTVLVKTGLRLALPAGYELQIRPRSGISLRTDLRISNSPGTIDSGYRGEVCILLTNTYRFKNINARVVDINGNKINNPPKGYPKLTVMIKKGDRIAQGVVSKVYQAIFSEVTNIDNVDKSTRGSGGFGSSGTR